jgi:hypothetical protein
MDSSGVLVFGSERMEIRIFGTIEDVACFVKTVNAT